MILRLLILLKLTYIGFHTVSGQHLKTHTIISAHIEATQQAPNIDGILEPQAWKNATLFSDFMLTRPTPGTLAQQPTKAYLTYDDSFLYIGVLCEYDGQTDFRTSAKNHDDPLIFYDDRIELFIDANHDHRTYYHFTVNTQAKLFDQAIIQHLPKTRTHYQDAAWNGFWTAQTQMNEKHWTTEIAISLESIGLKSFLPGTTIGFNIGRVHSPKVQPGDDLRTFEVHAPSEYSAWAEVRDGIWETVSNFYAPEDFGDLTLGNTGFQPHTIAFPDASFNGPLGLTTKAGPNPLMLQFDQLEHDLSLELVVTEPSQGKIFEKYAEEDIRWTQQQIIPKGSEEVHTEYMISGDQEQKLWISILDKQSKALLYRTSYILIVPPFIRFDLEALYSQSAIDQQITFTPDANIHKGNLQLALLDDHQNVIDSASFNSLPPQGKATPVFDTKKLRKLPGGNYSILSKLIDPQTTEVLLTAEQPLTKFGLSPPPVALEVVNEKYTYGGIEDDAVVVKFPSSARFVFWKAAAYVPWWDIDQAVTSNEFVESWGNGIEGCAEPLQDRECRFSSVEILENTPARVKVKWRYALNDTHYRIHANEWVEEYYTFYPDGSGIREVVLFATTNTAHEVFEAIYVNPPQVSTYQLYDDEIATLKNLEGQSYTVPQLAENASLYHDFIFDNDQLILESHFKDRLHPYTVFALDSSLMPNVLRENFSVGKYLSAEGTRRGHWPASRYAVDGYNAVGDDVPGHFNLGNIHVMSETGKGPNRWFFLIGTKLAEDNTDVIQAKNWLNPPALKFNEQPALNITYDKRQKAYIIPSMKDKASMTLENETLLHPVFIFEERGMAIEDILFNNRPIEDTDYRMALVDGRMIFYLDKILHKNDQLTFLLNP